ncbi:MAG: histidine phosphatase family protein [Planctomycetota bacterium]|jgi:probable phosphoglycerate mutase|nr:histidine phosphatase family protein [Planctomycetota bacterium]
MADAVYLIRHAAPPVEARGRYWGKRDPGIDPRSLAAAAAAADLVGRIPDRIVSSPLERARLTAEAVANRLGGRFVVTPDLEEIDFGEFDGLTYREIQSRHPDAAREWAERPGEFVFPGGCGVREFEARAETAWRRHAGSDDGTLLIVTHGGIISTWCCLFLDIDPARRFVFRPDYASLTLFVRRSSSEFWELACFNDRK